MADARHPAHDRGGAGHGNGAPHPRERHGGHGTGGRERPSARLPLLLREAVLQVYALDETCVEARVVCGGCHVSTTREHQSWRVWHGADELTRTLAIGRAISSWNRRAERTCRVGCYPPGYEDNLHYEVCSECGTFLTASIPGDRHAERASYCPNCGARVVSDDDLTRTLAIGRSISVWNGRAERT